MLLLWLKIINNDTDDSNILLLNEFKKKILLETNFENVIPKIRKLIDKSEEEFIEGVTYIFFNKLSSKKKS